LLGPSQLQTSIIRLGSKIKVKDTTIALVFVQEEIDEEISIEADLPVLLLFLTLPNIALLHLAAAGGLSLG